MGKKVGKGIIRISRDRGTHGRGFTLFELIVVLLLLGFVFFLTFPNFRQFIEPRDIKRGVLSFVGALKYAQSQAATTKKKYRLNIDVKENAFWISLEGEKGAFSRDPSSMGKPTYLPAGVSFLDVDNPERGKVREGTAYIEFSPTGWAEEGTIHMKKGDEEGYTIFVHPLGGKVEAVAGYLERRKG